MLYGQHRPDVQKTVRDAVGTERAEAWIEPDLSSNILGSASAQLSVLYDEPPVYVHEDPAAAELMTRILREAQHGPMMQRAQRDCIGLREIGIRIDVFGRKDAPSVALRPVFPDLVDADAHPDRPDMPARWSEARLRELGGQMEWAWDVHDITDPASPTWKVVRASDDADVSGKVLAGSWAGAGSYPWRWGSAEGEPFIPVVLFHASKTASLWDPWFGVELLDGTLLASVYWTFYGHTLLAASWPQRWAANAQVVGADSSNGEGHVVADPATVTMLESVGEAGDPIQVGQWQPGADPKTMHEAVSMYEQRVAQFAGIDATDFLRMSGDPRSGYALAISREGKRRAAKKMEPVFQAADVELLSKVAATVNRFAGRELLPETGWSISYQALPPSLEERQAKQTLLFEQYERGLISLAQLKAQLDGISVDEATRRLEAIAANTSDGAAGSATEA